MYHRLCVEVRGFFEESALSFCHKGSRDQTQVVALATEPWHCSSQKKPIGSACETSIPQILCCLSNDQESNSICNILNATNREGYALVFAPNPSHLQPPTTTTRLGLIGGFAFLLLALAYIG